MNAPLHVSPLLLLVAPAASPSAALVAAGLGGRELELERVEHVAQAVARLHHSDRRPDVVVLAADGAWQRAAARQLRHAEARIVLAFLVEPAREASVRQALLFEPAIGPDLHVVPLGPTDELGARLESIAVAAVRRTTHRAVLDKINAQLTRTRVEPADHNNLEAALREQQDRLALAVQAAELGIWGYDLVTRTLRWDDRCKAIFGLSADADIGYPDFLARIDADHRARVEALIARACEPGGGGRYHCEYRLAGRFAGEERWVSARGRAFFVDDRAASLLGTLQDISARKHAEDERAELLRRAEAARAEAEAASLLKDEFLATVSHELRTPLTAMLGWTRMLRAGTLAPEKRERALETIERNARAQARLIEDLLDFSRILAGKLRLDVQPVDLTSVIHASLESVRPAADAKQVGLDLLLEPGVGVVVGDAGRLQQVVWNLLSNAIKFTPRGGCVQVRLERVEAFVEIVVSDTGQGIRPDFLPHVFERFRQADGSSGRVHGGLGLGLAIVKQLTELHGGTVRAASDGEDAGASFTVRLPLAVRPAEPATHRRAHPQGPAPSGCECPAEIAGLRVLVVDDEPDARELLATVLEGCGATVTTAASVADAISEFPGVRPDIVVSDIGMPGEDGFGLIRRLRALPVEQGGRTPVVALTAYARAEDRTRALRAGFNMHIAKPIDPGELLAVVANLAGRLPAPRA